MLIHIHVMFYFFNVDVKFNFGWLLEAKKIKHSERRSTI